MVLKVLSFPKVNLSGHIFTTAVCACAHTHRHNWGLFPWQEAHTGIHQRGSAGVGTDAQPVRQTLQLHCVCALFFFFFPPLLQIPTEKKQSVCRADSIPAWWQMDRHAGCAPADPLSSPPDAQTSLAQPRPTHPTPLASGQLLRLKRIKDDSLLTLSFFFFYLSLRFSFLSMPDERPPRHPLCAYHSGQDTQEVYVLRRGESGGVGSGGGRRRRRRVGAKKKKKKKG